jgi:predicted DNA-binding protein (UPF0251 family)
MNESVVSGVMVKIAAGEISRQAAAETLGCDVRTVNRLMVRRGVTRPRSEYQRGLEERAERRGRKLEAAQSVITGRETLDSAAKKAGVTRRTLERWVEKAEKDAEKALKHKKNAGKSRKTAGNRQKS